MPFISGTPTSTLVVAIDSGTILSAALHVVGVADRNLPFTDQTVTVDAPGLPNGVSVIRLIVGFDPGDDDANVTVSSVLTGSATASDPPGILFNNDPANTAFVIPMRGKA